MEQISVQPKPARNPLSIIALFISFLYALSAAVLAARSDGLSQASEEKLVWFIILFPVAVLGVFARLVTKHHRKLYAPLDYRSDESFLSDAVDPKDVGRRLEREVAEADEAEKSGQSPEEVALSQEASPGEVERPPAPVGLVNAFVGEALAFQELQTEFSGSVRRQVALKGRNGRIVRVDGLIENEDARYIVEVKLQSGSSTFIARVTTAVKQVLYLKETLLENALRPNKYIVVVVANSHPTPAELGKARARLNFADGDRADLRVYLLPELMAKYGLSN